MSLVAQYPLGQYLPRAGDGNQALQRLTSPLLLDLGEPAAEELSVTLFTLTTCTPLFVTWLRL